MDGRMDRRTDDAKTISHRLRGITKNHTDYQTRCKNSSEYKRLQLHLIYIETQDKSAI